MESIDWDYQRRKCHLLMPKYIMDALKRFNCKCPKRIQNAPHCHIAPQYGAKQQFVQEEKESEATMNDKKLYIQQVLGTFLYYARAVNSTMLVALSAIAANQAAPTIATLTKLEQFLDYAASQEEAILTYHPSDMVLAVHSKASYLSESKAHSCANCHLYCSTHAEYPPNNGAVLTITQIIIAVMPSAAGAEVGAKVDSLC
mmetsp:Transcript_19791/g.35991  ORF Transcript_19791/g.35991 Transcript_19791/m.35991 type:complete len:201 (+) Transcript_19791:278-880(+)